MTSFIEQNRKFWSRYSPSTPTGKKLLIEDLSRPMIVHVNAIFSLILNQSRGYEPVWLYSDFAKDKSAHEQLVSSYVPSATVVTKKPLSTIVRIKVVLIGLYKLLTMGGSKNLIRFSYQGVRYGDLVYDTYLTQRHVATIRHIDRFVFKTMLQCMARHETVKRLLKSDSFVGVMVSHQVGIKSGVMLRVALHYGYMGFLRCGHHEATLQQFRTPDEVYDYEYKPTKADIENIFNRVPSVEETYRATMQYQIEGKGDKEALDAYSKKNAFYNNRQSFNAAYSLDPNKKNVVIMMHALNDYPHSHFRWMIFKDYYDWLQQNYQFALQHDHVNWIFKQHPSIKLYRTDDFSGDEMFKNKPEHIVYIDENKQIDTRSLRYCADLVITVIGSAGFELPALAAVPSMISGDTFYNGLGFTLEPKNKKEYFDILMDAERLKPLTVEQQRIAQAVYIHIYSVSRVPLAASPQLTYDQEKDSSMARWYWSAVEERYAQHAETIYAQIERYIKETRSEETFSKLTNLEALPKK